MLPRWRPPIWIVLVLFAAVLALKFAFHLHWCTVPTCHDHWEP
jgi:hypothetical protein